MKILEVLIGLALLGPAKLKWKEFQGEADKQISELTPSKTSRLSGGLVGIQLSIPSRYQNAITETKADYHYPASTATGHYIFLR